MLMTIWSVVLVLVALIWASRHWEITRSTRLQERLHSQMHPARLKVPPRVSVLIAAKDEEQNIERAVRTFLEQDYSEFELIVINDRSNDRTGQILEQLKTEFPDGRFKPVHVTELEDGWFGKNNAMRVGVSHASGQWFCFGDADCCQTSTRSLSVALQYAVESGVDFLSVLPRFENRTAWEQIVQPVCGSVMMLRFNPRWVNDPKHPAAYANGAFMLISRECYDAIGGHAAVRTEVNEDMHMARLAKERGRRLYVVENEDLYTVRMYSTFGDIFRGWTRIFYGCFGSYRRLAVALTMLIVANAVPYLSALVAGAVLLTRGWTGAGGGWQSVAVTALLAIVVQQTVIFRFYRVIRVNPLLAPTFIVGATICMGMLINAMRRIGGKASTTWRGTTYRADKVTAA